jgi:hypothetical protein
MVTTGGASRSPASNLRVEAVAPNPPCVEGFVAAGTDDLVMGRTEVMVVPGNAGRAPCR